MKETNDIVAQFRKDVDKVTDELRKAYETISKLKVENEELKKKIRPKVKEQFR